MRLNMGKCHFGYMTKHTDFIAEKFSPGKLTTFHFFVESAADQV